MTLDFDGEASDIFAEVTRAMSGTGQLFAIVLDGVVLSAPQVNSAITNGSAQITGDFTIAEAESLANSLKYGALPLSFQVPVETIEGPTLAGDQPLTVVVGLGTSLRVELEAVAGAALLPSGPVVGAFLGTFLGVLAAAILLRPRRR